MDPTEELDPSNNPELVEFASWLGIDYLTAAIALLHNRSAVNGDHIDALRKRIISKFKKIKEQDGTNQ